MLRRRRIGLPAAVGAAMALGLAAGLPSSRAQTLRVEGTWPTERETRVQVRLLDTHAEVRVRSVLGAAGPDLSRWQGAGHPEPPAVAVGLRVRRRGKQRWRSVPLVAEEALLAAERGGPAESGPPFTTIWSWFEGLQVYPVSSVAEVELERTLHVPTTYRWGRYYFALAPWTGDHHKPKQGVLISAPRGRARRVEPHEVPFGSTWTHELQTFQAPRIRARLAAVDTSQRQLVHYEAQAAPRLSRAPHGARVVLLVDTSRSHAGPTLEAAFAAAHHYVRAHAQADPGVRVRVATFDREVTPWYGRFVAPDAALKDLWERTPAQRNGSDLNAALGWAATQLRRAPASAPRRILVVSDLLTASTVRPAQGSERLRGAQAVVHLMVPSQGHPAVRRLDEHPWASVPRQTGGVLWQVQALGAARPAARDVPSTAYEGLVRPTALDNVRLTPMDGLAPLPGIPHSLHEGEQLRFDAFSERAAAGVVLEGELWSRRVRIQSASSPALERLWAGLFTGQDLSGELEDGELEHIALAGHALSPRTGFALVGTEPKPEEPNLGNLGFVAHHTGGGSGSGYGRGDGKDLFPPSYPDPQTFLNREIRTRWQMCGGRQLHGQFAIETTHAEIVRAGPFEGPGTPSPDLQACMRIATWSVELPPNFDEPFARWHVTL